MLLPMKKKSMHRLDELRRMGRERLKQAGIAGYGLDADVLLMYVLQMDKNTLLTSPDKDIPDGAAAEYRKCLIKREGLMPVAYIVGKCEFMSLEFDINRHVLIPRPDTEVLVETILAAENAAEGLEIGIGSGCISVSLMFYNSQIAMDGADICPKAVAIARENACKHNVTANFFVSDVFENMPPRRYDFIVSNPPYIPTGDIAALGLNVRGYEPANALDGGPAGLDFYRRVAAGTNFLRKGGRIYFEIGHNQGRDVAEILSAAGFSEIGIKRDIAGKDRVVHAIIRKE